MQLIDTHCHIHEATVELHSDNPTHALWLKAGSPNPDDIIERAKKDEVSGMICVGTTAPDSQVAVDFVQDRMECWASVGIHPHEAQDGEAELTKLKALAGKPKVVAVGECGLDYFYNHSPKQDQVAALQFQIELALEHNLPMIFHVREAFDDFWPIFDSYQGIRGVLHSFTDTQANADKALERGLYIGMNGIITFTKNDDQLAMAKRIPLQKLLLETDAPFLTPAPHRGTVNEPARTRVVAEFLATLRDEVLADLAAQTSKNARELFGL